MILRKTKRIGILLLGMVLLLGLMPFPGFADSFGDPRFSVAPLSFLRLATPGRNFPEVPVRAAPSAKADQISVISRGSSWEVVEEGAKYDRVRLPDGSGFGYAPREMLTLRAETADPALREHLDGTLALEDAAPLAKAKHLVFSGSLRSPESFDTLFLFVWDERRLQVEYTWVKNLDRPVTDLSAALLEKALPLHRLSGGRKQVVLEAAGEKETFVLFRSAAYISRDLKEPLHITALCEGIPDTLRDNRVTTAWRPTPRQDTLTIRIPEDADAALLSLEWKVPCASLQVTQLDEAGTVLFEETRRNRFYMDAVPLVPEVRTLVLKPADPDCDLSTLRVYASGYPGHAVQQWQPVPDKIDILLVSAHQDDDLLFFGGAVPYYSWRDDVSIAVLYLADCGRYRYREALDGLWSAGLKYHPLFLGLRDILSYDLQAVEKRWQDREPEKLLTRVIRQYRPEVILVQDFDGEYGHAQHMLAARLAAESRDLAEQPDYDPESAAQWGTWSVKKLYAHLYGRRQIRMDWDRPLSDAVITPMFLAKEGFDKHKDQLQVFSMENQGTRYDNRLFGLYYSAVGDDIAGDDFMENIPRP